MSTKDEVSKVYVKPYTPEDLKWENSCMKATIKQMEKNNSKKKSLICLKCQEDYDKKIKSLEEDKKILLKNLSELVAHHAVEYGAVTDEVDHLKKRLEKDGCPCQEFGAMEENCEDYEKEIAKLKKDIAGFYMSPSDELKKKGDV